MEYFALLADSKKEKHSLIIQRFALYFARMVFENNHGIILHADSSILLQLAFAASEYIGTNALEETNEKSPPIVLMPNLYDGNDDIIEDQILKESVSSSESNSSFESFEEYFRRQNIWQREKEGNQFLETFNRLKPKSIILANYSDSLEAVSEAAEQYASQASKAVELYHIFDLEELYHSPLNNPEKSMWSPLESLLTSEEKAYRVTLGGEPFIDQNEDESSDELSAAIERETALALALTKLFENN